MKCSRILVLIVFVFQRSAIEAFKLNPEFQSWVGCISLHEAKILLAKRGSIKQSGEAIQFDTSIDLSQTITSVLLSKEGLCLKSTDQLLATWAEIDEIAKSKNQGCYSLYDDGSKPWHVSTISKSTGIPASLCAPLSEGGSPTMVLGGFTMHRIAGDNMNPMIDTAAKISSIKFFGGAKVLDTCMGLGYTAIGAARKVKEGGGKVTTIEYDEASIEMSAHNPWSQGLFDGSLPIEVIQGDSCEVVRKFPSGSFNAIIHDPPARALSRTDVYGQQFYSQLRRILTNEGQLFHYIGNPDSKESGRLYKGIETRLQEAGFVNIKKVERAYGLIASAGRPRLLGGARKRTASASTSEEEDKNSV